MDNKGRQIRRQTGPVILRQFWKSSNEGDAFQFPVGNSDPEDGEILRMIVSWRETSHESRDIRRIRCPVRVIQVVHRNQIGPRARVEIAKLHLVEIRGHCDDKIPIR